MNKVAVLSLDKKYKSDAKKISALARKVFLLLKKNNLAADIYLIGNRTMRKLNRTYRKKDKATNVLTFCEPKKFINAPSKYKYLGEIHISPDFIKSRRQDMNLIVVHGMLHLLGYDHKTAKERMAMEKKERLLLEKN